MKPTQAWDEADAGTEKIRVNGKDQYRQTHKAGKITVRVEVSYPMKELWLYIDGASKGNPGPAGIGVVLTMPDGETMAEIGDPIGITTNNVAEYKALIRGLTEAQALGAQKVTVQTDSQLLARQMEGRYKINAPHLRALQQEAATLRTYFPGGVVISHILRAGNARADLLANQGAFANRPASPAKP